MKPRFSIVLAGLLLAASVATSMRGQQHPNVAQGFGADKAFQIGDIDHINLFNGNLVLTLPLGGSYAIGPELSLGFTLHYNSKIWEYEEDDVGRPTTIPQQSFNAGAGWSLSLGRLGRFVVPPGFPQPSPELTPLSFAYTSPDGALHAFYGTLHAGDSAASAGPTVGYARDGTYLRLNISSLAAPIVEASDGTQHFFELDPAAPATAPRYRLKEIRDRFGNWVRVSYLTSPVRWSISDIHGRSYTVTFRSDAGYGGYGPDKAVVQTIDLPAFGSQRAVYTLEHERRTVSVPCPDLSPEPEFPTNVTIPLLARVKLAGYNPATGDVLYDMSRYDPPAAPALGYVLTNTPNVCDGTRSAGMITGLRLPTQGRIEWDWGARLLIDRLAERCREFFSGVTVVKERRTESRHGGTIGRWRYSQLPLPVPWNCSPTSPGEPPTHTTIVVTDPLGNKTENNFSITDVVNGQFVPEEYGLPISYLESSGGAYLSTKTFQAGSSTPIRATYVRYETDDTATIPGPRDSPLTERNQRLAQSRVVYLDDGNRYKETVSSDFDGLGHYRTVTARGNFRVASEQREVRTNYNPTRGIYPHKGVGSSYQSVLPSQIWLHDTYDEVRTTEAGDTAVEQLCMDTTTGALLRHRVLVGATPGASDVLRVFTHSSAGSTTSRKDYGGDQQTLGTGALCSLAPPAATAYSERYTHQFGVQATTELLQPNETNALPYKPLDRTIDRNSGLPVSSRDPAGLTTSFDYDMLGRIETARPAAGHGAWTALTYSAASPPGADSGARASVGIKQYDNGGESVLLAASGIVFDDLGRVYRETVDMPDGSVSRRQTLYDDAGNKSRVSEWDTIPTLGAETIYAGYDPFGRPGQITPPDGASHVVTVNHTGDRRVVRTVKVGTTLASGLVTESDAATTELYDSFGRLFQVDEPAGAGGTTVTTLYDYDVGSRLKKVRQAGQVREMTYDHRGFLLSEKHPEKGVSGDGTVSYGLYDARGHAGKKVDGPFDLRFSYDRGERLLTVSDQAGARLLKEFAYDSLPATEWLVGAHAAGKRVRAIRHNWLAIPWSPTVVIDAGVKEYFRYDGRDGRVSEKRTAITFGSLASFRQTWAYDALGQVTTIGYPSCEHTTCTGTAGANPARSVSPSYTKGWLTGVGTWGTVAYHPNGAIEQIVHGNGVTDTHGIDPNDLLRPSSITTTATSLGLDAYKYDGAGNVVAQSATTTMLYDKVSRLVEMRYGTPDRQSYSYDAFGNQLSKTTVRNNGAAVTTTTPVLGLTNRLSGAVYDAAGNVTAWGGYTYQMDAFGLIGNLQGGGNNVSHIYTADDERLFTMHYPGSIANLKETWRLRDLGMQVLREWTVNGGDAAGNWGAPKDTIYRGSQLLASVTGTAQSHYTLDHLGTPRVLTNNTGGVISQHKYFGFGEELTPTTNDALKFTGHERDYNMQAGTTDDLDYMHARYYSAGLGRFLSVDPAESARLHMPQSWNRYSYAWNSPQTYLDLTGRAPSTPQTIVVGRFMFHFDPLSHGKPHIDISVRAGGRWNKIGRVDLELKPIKFMGRVPNIPPGVMKSLRVTAKGAGWIGVVAMALQAEDLNASDDDADLRSAVTELKSISKEKFGTEDLGSLSSEQRTQVINERNRRIAERNQKTEDRLNDFFDVPCYVSLSCP